jgi:hypothetical protein
LFAPLGYCQQVGVIDDEQGEARAVLTDDVRSPHLSPGIRVACMGAGNYWHERNRERNCERNCESNRRYYNGYDGNHHRYHGHHRYEHHGHNGHDGHHHRYDNRNYRYHRHHGYDGHHHKHPPAT